MKQHKILHILAVLAVIAVLVLLPACKKEEPRVTKVVQAKVGFLGAMTGGAASIGVPTTEAARLAEEQINAQNLIPGKKLKIVYEDDQCDAKSSSNAVQKLITQDKAVAIVGSLCSGATLADAPISEQNKVLQLSYGSTNPSIKDAGDYIFRNVPSDANQGVEAAKLLKQLGAQKVAVTYINNDWGAGLKEVFVAAAAEQGMEVVAEETYEPSATDFRAQLTKVKAASPDMVYMLAYPADTGLVLKQLRELGLTLQVVGADASKDDAIIATAGQAAEGLIVTLPGVPASPELEAFATAYKAKYGKEYSAYTPEAYDAVMIVAKACAATDCTSTAMKNYLYTMGPYKGASGTYEFDENGEVEKSYDYFTVEGGKFVPYTSEEAEEEYEEGAEEEASEEGEEATA
ncbi:ABC transporter substrate-binding protein [Candidatus Woesearchaeota archaeon]|nr:ABC transporter substrate-binding protein [Candidatus Woesearchaeota archaeon]